MAEDPGLRDDRSGREFTLLFVCTGNTCRSSMAAAICRRLVEELAPGARLRVLSAGTAALAGAPATPHARAALSERGVNLSDHRATPLTPDLVRRADLVLTMTRGHRRTVLDMVPEAENKVFTLGEFVAGDQYQNSETEAERHRRALKEFEERFRRDHQAEMEDLKRRRRELLAELERVEGLLQYLEDLEQQESAAERRAIEDAESRLAELDISDPFGQPLESYQKCADELEDLCRRLVQKLHDDDSVPKEDSQ